MTSRKGPAASAFACRIRDAANLADSLQPPVVAALRAAIAVDSDKDEYDNFDKEFQYADENLAEQIERSNYDRSRPQRAPVDGDRLEDEEEIPKWVLHSRAETEADAADAADA
jgi:hypothetical protein